MLPCEEAGRWRSVVILPPQIFQTRATFSFGNEKRETGRGGIERGNRTRLKILREDRSRTARSILNHFDTDHERG